MGTRVSPEQQAAFLATPGVTVGKSVADFLNEQAAARPSTQPPAPDCDEVTEFMPRVIALAESLGWEVWHCRNAKFSKAGFLDLELCRPPRLLKIELKSENGTLTAGQKKWLNLYRLCPGIEAFVFWPKDWNQIQELLK